MNKPGWAWYVARWDELMLDVDSGTQGSVLGATRIRLEAAIKGGCLKIAGPLLWVYRSKSPGHYHIIIRLTSPMPAIERYSWEMQLRSDLYRARCNIMRELYEVSAPALLIAPGPWPMFYRDPDAICECEEKHTFKVIGSCPAALKLRGEGHAQEGFFGRLAPGRKVLAITLQEGPCLVERFACSVDKDGNAD